MKILALKTDRLVSKKLLSKLNFENTITEVANFDKSEVYDVLYMDWIHIGMDEEFEPIVDRIESGELKVKKIVFLATAGIDHEVDPTWISEIQLKELILEVQYVAKLVDETEVPYTILRPVEVKDELKSNDLVIVPEGNQITNSYVSLDGLSSVIQKVIQTDKYINQSIGIYNRK